MEINDVLDALFTFPLNEPCVGSSGRTVSDALNKILYLTDYMMVSHGSVLYMLMQDLFSEHEACSKFSRIF